ncbi:alpha/beta hydrolase [Nocardia fluminea]|uniref:alpha/beta hydrolase n=1 Tax=Nocardia fluminea TaxID=134984 RepID=UPI0037A898E0
MDFAGRMPEMAREVADLGPMLRGYSEWWDIASGCVGWPIPSAWQPHPWHAAPSLPPTLLVSGAHDIATPRVFATGVHQQLGSSSLLTWEGEGHTAWISGNQCAKAAITQYLVTVDPGSAHTCK